MKSIRLTDGTLLEPQVNFLTIKLLQEAGFSKLDKVLNKMPNNPNIQMKYFSKIAYALIRSSGRKVDEEEAMMLLPFKEIDTVVDVLYEFAETAEKFKKKPTMNTKKKKK